MKRRHAASGGTERGNKWGEGGVQACWVQQTGGGRGTEALQQQWQHAVISKGFKTCQDLTAPLQLSVCVCHFWLAEPWLESHTNTKWKRIIFKCLQNFQSPNRGAEKHAAQGRHSETTHSSDLVLMLLTSPHSSNSCLPAAGQWHKHHR